MPKGRRTTSIENRFQDWRCSAREPVKSRRNQREQPGRSGFETPTNDFHISCTSGFVFCFTLTLISSVTSVYSVVEFLNCLCSLFPPVFSRIVMPRRKTSSAPSCSPAALDPVTGFYRTGCCETGPDDLGLHLVCSVMSSDFLEFSRLAGNDLSTPVPEYGFPGLSPGDRWCLCVQRWKEAFEAGAAPQVVLEATHMSSLEFVSLEELQAHAVHA